MEMLAVGDLDLWVFLLRFPAQSCTTTNTTSDQPGFHWCTLVSWFHMLDHCADKEPFFAENTVACVCLSFPKSLHLWPYSGHVCYVRSRILIMPQHIIHKLPVLLVHCSSSVQWCTCHCLRSLNAISFMAFSDMYFPFICTASSFTSAFSYHSLMTLA